MRLRKFAQVEQLSALVEVGEARKACGFRAVPLIHICCGGCNEADPPTMMTSLLAAPKIELRHSMPGRMPALQLQSSTNPILEFPDRP
jgi:hypothetical protein